MFRGEDWRVRMSAEYLRLGTNRRLRESPLLQQAHQVWVLLPQLSVGDRLLFREVQLALHFAR